MREQVVLVTGASSGIGRACVIELLRRGHRVFGTTRRDPQPLTDEIRRETGVGEAFDAITMDVNHGVSVQRGVETIAARAGHIDGVINCAGMGIAGAIEDTDDDEAESIFATNFFGTLRVCRAVLPIMRQEGRGTIINVSSIGGRIALPFQGLYSATKFAVEGLTDSLRMEVRRFGVRVVLIEPGDFCTGFTDSRQRVRKAGSEAYSDTFERSIRVAENDERKGASPESIGQLAARILASRSPRARYLIGPRLQRIAVGLKSILPASVFDWALRMYYRVH